MLKGGRMGTALVKKRSRSKRDDAIVTARVPVEIKRQGNAVLKKIGSTPTELVNAAYRYVLEREELPVEARELKPRVIRLTDEQKQTLRDRNERATCVVPESFWQGKSYKDLLEEAMREKYEALA